MIIDASVWVSFFVTSEARHAVIYKWLMVQFTNNILILVPQLVLAEVGGAVSRRVGDAEARNALGIMKALPILQL